MGIPRERVRIGCGRPRLPSFPTSASSPAPWLTPRFCRVAQCSELGAGIGAVGLSAAAFGARHVVLSVRRGVDEHADERQRLRADVHPKRV